MISQGCDLQDFPEARCPHSNLQSWREVDWNALSCATLLASTECFYVSWRLPISSYMAGNSYSIELICLISSWSDCGKCRYFTWWNQIKSYESKMVKSSGATFLFERLTPCLSEMKGVNFWTPLLEWSAPYWSETRGVNFWKSKPKLSRILITVTMILSFLLIAYLQWFLKEVFVQDAGIETVEVKAIKLFSFKR